MIDILFPYQPVAYAKCMDCGRKVYFENKKLCHKVYDNTLCTKRECQGKMVVLAMTDEEKKAYARNHLL